MKKTLKTIIALFMVLSLTVGCTMREHIKMVIDEDGTTSMNLIVAMDNEMIDGMLSMQNMNGDSDPTAAEKKTYTDEERWAYIESDSEDSAFSSLDDSYKKERYSEGEFKGIKATQELGSLDKISAESADKKVNIIGSSDDNAGKELKDQVLFIKDGKTYKSNMTIDLGEEANDMSQYSSYGATFELKLVIELPVKPISNNADEVSSDGKTLTWDLLKAKDVELEFSLDDSGSSKGNSKDKKSSKDDDDEKSKMWLYVGIGAGAAVLILIIIVVAVVSSKKKKAQNANAAIEQSQPVMAPTFEQPVEPPVQPIQHAEPTEQPVDPNQQQ